MEIEYYKKLVEKYLIGDISDTERAELSSWIRSDKRISEWWEQELEKSDRAIDLSVSKKMFSLIETKLHEESEAVECAQEIQNAHSLRISKKRHVRRLYNWMKWTAIIIIPICIASLTYFTLNTESEQLPFIVKANSGDKATVVLPDGTNVILNSASELQYMNDFGKKERRVSLEGEGYFNVAHDTQQTFIVQVGDLEVKVLGTEFNVCAYGDSQDISVVLLKGKVGIYTPTSSLKMLPGDRIKYNKTTRKMISEKVYANDYIAWTQGNLYFQNETLDNIMRTFSRIYNVSIRIDSPKIAKERFTGTIPGGSIRKALDILSLTSFFQYEVKDSTIILTEK